MENYYMYGVLVLVVIIILFMFYRKKRNSNDIQPVPTMTYNPYFSSDEFSYLDNLPASSSKQTPTQLDYIPGGERNNFPMWDEYGRMIDSGIRLDDNSEGPNVLWSSDKILERSGSDKRIAGLYSPGTIVYLDNLGVGLTSANPSVLQVATKTGTMNVWCLSESVADPVVTGKPKGLIKLTTTPQNITGVVFANNNAANSYKGIICDTDNKLVYKYITMIVGEQVFISLEKISLTQQ